MKRLRIKKEPEIMYINDSENNYIEFLEKSIYWVVINYFVVAVFVVLNFVL